MPVDRNLLCRSQRPSVVAMSDDCHALTWPCGLRVSGRTLSFIFWHIKRAARRISSGSGKHAAAVRAESAVYQEWLQPRVRAFLAKTQTSAAAKRLG